VSEIVVSPLLQILDAVNPATNSLANRRVDRDFYQNFGVENRNVLEYNLGKTKQHLAFGARLYKANTTRQQQGRGTTGNDFDLSIDGAYPRDLNFTTENVAFCREPI
jgi:Fe(3+) dicitrate transport protein